jgi:tRNA (adenine37-N6)-methyltransferase
MSTPFTVVPIGTVSSGVREIADDVFGGTVSRITLDAGRFTPEALAGLDEYSHVEILFLLDRIPESKIDYGLRRPRGRMDWPVVGIFAQRAKNRPNRIGSTVCRLIAVEGLSIQVAALDAIDGTPVIDIKPYLREFGPREEVRQPAWATELMSSYWS